MNRTHFPRILTILFGSFVGFALMSCRPATGTPPAQNGHADLSSWDLQKQGIVRLDGTWDFYYGEFYSSGDFGTALPRDPLHAFLPGYWQDLNMNGEKLSAKGFATYRLQIRLSPEDEKRNVSLYIPHAFTAYKLFANGVMVATNGTPGKTAEQTREQFLPLIASIPHTSRDVELIIHVSNFESAKAGFRQSLEIGPETAILKKKELLLAEDVFLAGAVLVIAFYHLYLYILRPGESYALYFFLYSSLLAVYKLTTGEYFFVMLFPDLEWEWTVRLFFLSIFVGMPFLLMFATDLYPREAVRPFSRVLEVLFFSLAIPVLAEKSSWIEGALAGAEFLFLIACLYILYIFARAAMRKREGALGFAFGFTVFFAASINDILFEKDLVRTEVYAPVGFFTLILSQAFTLLRRFTHVLEAVERQQVQLQESFLLKQRLYRFRIRAKRMELELLKKTIQPHFLMNTLAAIRAWLLENPSQSSRLLDEFSAELALILRVANRQTIPLSDEIELCRHHVRVMEIRREKAYIFRVRGVAGDEMIPPLIFHTMVENAFSHSDTAEGRLTMLLVKRNSSGASSSPSGVEYLFAVRNSRPNSPITNAEKKGRAGTGTGLSYIRSRLEESYPGAWSMNELISRRGHSIKINLKAEAHV